ncbi:MAG: hypothetical protein KF819_11280 [Labilithrix sp.]|nr:hypothetical protein [Labilithrix sp.]
MRSSSSLGLFLVAASLVACNAPAEGPDGPNGRAGGGRSAPPATRFFLPTGEPTNTSNPTLAIDADDAIHSVYPEYVRGGAFYAFCPASCAGPDDVKLVHFPTVGTVHDAMIALDAQGKPSVLLSTGQRVYYASCDGDCTDQGAWTSSVILEHGGDREVTGKAFALDRQGRPRFLMHTTKAYLGVGQKKPETFWAACDAGCNAASAWRVDKISDQMWRSSHLIFDAQNRAHVATVANVGRTESSSGKEMGAYVTCAGDCAREDAWEGTALSLAFESELDAVRIPPAISLALTKAGQPRVVMLGMFEDTMKRNITYLACDARCTGDGWVGSVLSGNEKIGAGVDLVLDANDKPRFVHTLDYDIALASCDQDRCEVEDAKWDLATVEYAGSMKKDEIFLYANCTVAAWFLHSPSVALTKDGRARVGYQARDISGGFGNADPVRTPDCRAGTDMTWSRLAML